MRTRRGRGTGWAILLAMLGVACSDGDPTGTNRPPAGPAPVASVEITPETVELLVGGTRGLNATPKAADGTPLSGRPVAWSSGDTTVATVDLSGNVTARREGTVTISASSGGRTGRASVRIDPLTVASVKVTPQEAGIGYRGSRVLGVELYAADGRMLTDRVVTWASGDTSIATVDAQGKVTAKRAGVVVITAASEGKSAWSRVTVAMPPAAGPYRLTIWDVRGAGTLCVVDKVRLDVRQEGGALTGEASGFAGGPGVDCRITADEPPPYTTPFPPSGPFTGTVSDRAEIALSFEFHRWELRGTLHAGGMSGTATLREVVNGREITRTGRFQADRIVVTQ